jgi:hypothetical protein
MVRRVGHLFCVSCVMAALLLLSSNMAVAQDNESIIREVIQKHQQSLGKAEEVAKVKSRGVSGSAGVQFTLGATGSLTGGTFMTVSEGGNIGMVLQFDDVNYPGEYFAHNGKEVTVKNITPGQRSPLGDFIFRNPGIVREGLLGGVISVGWPLLKHENERPVFLYSKGKMGDREVHVLEYSPKNRLRGISVKLFFDAETYRHIRTEYEIRQHEDLTARQGIVSSIGQFDAAKPAVGSLGTVAKAPSIKGENVQPVSIYRMVETFGEFADVGGIMLPQLYMIDYSLEGSGATFIARWLVVAEHWMNNGAIDQLFFVAQ